MALEASIFEILELGLFLRESVLISEDGDISVGPLGGYDVLEPYFDELLEYGVDLNDRESIEAHAGHIPTTVAGKIADSVGGFIKEKKSGIVQWGKEKVTRCVDSFRKKNPDFMETVDRTLDIAGLVGQLTEKVLVYMAVDDLNQFFGEQNVKKGGEVALKGLQWVDSHSTEGQREFVNTAVDAGSMGGGIILKGAGKSLIGVIELESKSLAKDKATDVVQKNTAKQIGNRAVKEAAPDKTKVTKAVDQPKSVSSVQPKPTQYKYWNREVDFQGKRVYQRNDLFDPHYVDNEGISNIQKMSKGKAPIGRDGQTMNLHHSIQENEGPIIEILRSDHIDHSKILHIYLFNLKVLALSFENHH